VLRDREDFVAISPEGDGIVVHKLNYPNEIRKISDVPQLTHDLELPAKELELARTLIDNMAITIAEVDMRDQYTQALREVIEAKIAGREVAGFVEAEQPVVDIMTALKNSLKQTKRQPMAKAGKAKAAPAKAKPARKRKLG
jgi:DNA end-binding protein Ku